MASLSFRNVSKTFGGRTRAVDDLTLTVEDGEVMVLVGPSGCGKTTALRMAAGLERADSGEISIDSRVVNDVEPQHRDIAMVFQNYALYPHMDVFANLAFGLKVRRVPKADRKRKIEEIAGVLGLKELLHRRPSQLSGGQRQRVAMGRAIVREPLVWLMDEPLSNLDAKLRVQMRAEISRIQLELGVTTLYVTHDQVEALTIGSRVAVMRAGRLQQVAAPRQVYDAPANLFVAGFIGSPAMNFRHAEVMDLGPEIGIRVGNYITSVTGTSSLSRFVGGSVAIGFRPEHLQLANSESRGPRLRGRVILTESIGSALLVHVQCDGRAVETDDVVEALSNGGEETADIPLTSRDGVVHIAQLAADEDVHTGDTVELAVDPHRMRFFDVATGGAVDGVRLSTTQRVERAA